MSLVHWLKDTVGQGASQPVGTSTPMPIEAITLPTIGGERNTSSSTNNYTVVKQECNITRTTGTSEVLVSAAPVYVLGIIAESATAGTCTLRDASATGGGTTGYTVTTLASVTPISWDLKGARMEIGLTYQVGTGGNYLILWRPI